MIYFDTAVTHKESQGAEMSIESTGLDTEHARAESTALQRLKEIRHMSVDYNAH
jgi:hypothetical protein